MPSIPLPSQVSRALRRALTEEEAATLAKAEKQGYNIAGWHYGRTPGEGPTTRAGQPYHLDLTPYGNQAFARGMMTAQQDRYTTPAEARLMVARLKNPLRMTDEEVNELTPTIANATKRSGTIYPNTTEIGTVSHKYLDDNLLEAASNRGLRTGLERYGPVSEFIDQQPKSASAVMNPSAAVFDPANVRQWDAKFDSNLLGKPSWRGSADPRLLAGMGGAALAGSVMMKPSSPAPAINEDLPLERVPLTGGESIADILASLFGK